MADDGSVSDDDEQLDVSESLVSLCPRSMCVYCD